MRLILLTVITSFFPILLKAQSLNVAIALDDIDGFGNGVQVPTFKKKLYQQNYGAIIGLQRGAGTAIEMGAEMHWRKISLASPSITGATLNMNYNFGRNVIGYQGGVWTKQGRINLTYGANVVYYSDFHHLQRFGGGPSVGFRLAGFHLINGFNLLGGDKELEGANSLYMSLRYYFPVSNKFTWDRKTVKAKKERQRERQKRKDERAADGEGKWPMSLFKKRSPADHQ